MTEAVQTRFACNICGARNSSELGVRADRRVVVVCQQCGMGVLDNPPENTKLFYCNDYYHAAENKTGGYQCYEFTAEHTLLWTKILIAALRSDGRVLDVGCADGHLLCNLSGDYETYGIEVNEAMAAKAAAFGVKILAHDVYAPELAGQYANFFDIITSIATFEHVLDLQRAVRISLDLLKPDGVLIFEVPLISDTNDNTTWFTSSLEHIYYPRVSGLEYLFRDVLGAQLVGGEVQIKGFASNYVGLVAKDKGRVAALKRLFDVMTQPTLEGLGDPETALNLSFTVVHAFQTTPEKILALPVLFQRSLSVHIGMRLTQLWYEDAVRLRKVLYDYDIETKHHQWFEQQASNWEIAHRMLAAEAEEIREEVARVGNARDHAADEAARLAEAHCVLSQQLGKVHMELSAVSKQRDELETRVISLRELLTHAIAMGNEVGKLIDAADAHVAAAKSEVARITEQLHSMEGENAGLKRQL